ncbi:hypothetical protein RchiOBHm_Chr5g0023501 [Rosa chinensis]|uniref:Uncharacterized protein n=1 Tax=Rosa chinensis TaxID=74649 RepID=A0A2P6Q829_ROSCH|nr:hypothetical protein RchiOBHm_Chr5g0023501 [Rosa chinensis]
MDFGTASYCILALIHVAVDLQSYIWHSHLKYLACFDLYYGILRINRNS